MSSADLAYDLNDNPERSGSRRPSQVKLRQTCDACQAIKTRCSRDQPACQRCRNQNIQCHYSVSRRIGRPRRQVPPQTAASTPCVTRPDVELSVTSASRNEVPSISQPSSGVFPLDWNIVDVGVDRDRMVTETSESLSTRSSDALAKEQRSENNSSMTPRIGQASVGNVEAATGTSGIDGQDRYMESILGLSGSSHPSSMSGETDTASSHVSQPSTLESIYNFRQQLEHNAFDIAASEHEFDPNGPFSWDLLTAPVSPTRDDVCQCLESALSVTISIERQGHAFAYPGAMDLALGVEEQLREAVPIAVQCLVCKPRQADVLNMFSNAMAHMVDLFQHLCEVELFDNKESPDTQTDTSPMLDRFKWPPPKLSGRISSTNSQHLIPYDRSMFTSVSHSPKHSTASAQHRESNNLYSHHKLEGWRVLVGRHLIVGDDRKCILKHLLRRRLGALSSVLESLIRATQDLRMGPKRTDLVNSCVDRGPNRFAEIDTRKPVKTASKLYDIIDELERMEI